MAYGCCRLVEHRLGIEVVADLHHSFQHLGNAVTADIQQLGVFGCATLHQLYTLQVDTQTRDLLSQRRRKIVLTTNGQGNEHGVVVVPAPAFAIVQRLLERTVGNNLSANAVDTQITDAGSQCDDIVLRQHGVETSHAVDVTHQCMSANLTGIKQTGLVLVLRT